MGAESTSFQGSPFIKGLKLLYLGGVYTHTFAFFSFVGYKIYILVCRSRVRFVRKGDFEGKMDGWKRMFCLLAGIS